MEIYRIARDFMEKHGNPNQWGPTNWPPTELIANDIENDNIYVCLNNNKIIATFFFVQGKDIEPTYAEITDGSWIDDALYGVIHRIASDGTKRGVRFFCINWAYEQCNHLRIDTHVDNLIMQNLLKKTWIYSCGTIYVEKDNYPRLAYEKTRKWINHHKF